MLWFAHTYRPPQLGWVSEQVLYGQWTRLSLFRRESGHARLNICNVDHCTVGTPTLGNSAEATASSFSMLVTPRTLYSLIRYITAAADHFPLGYNLTAPIMIHLVIFCVGSQLATKFVVKVGWATYGCRFYGVMCWYYETRCNCFTQSIVKITITPLTTMTISKRLYNTF